MKRLLSPLPVFALLAMLLAAPAWTAPGVDIFINNKPFKGASSGPPGDLMLEAGLLRSDPSTILDLTKDPPTVIREGKGPVGEFLAL